VCVAENLNKNYKVHFAEEKFVTTLEDEATRYYSTELGINTFEDLTHIVMCVELRPPSWSLWPMLWSAY
jgi:hypothetical protein